MKLLYCFNEHHMTADSTTNARSDGFFISRLKFPFGQIADTFYMDDEVTPLTYNIWRLIHQGLSDDLFEEP
jgi:hypothetical protein